MKRWLIILAAAVLGSILGALFGRQYLVQPTRHEREIMHIASAQRARNNAETCVNILAILEDQSLGIPEYHRADAAKEFCATQLAFYYKMFADADDTHAPGQRYLLNLIKEDAEKWPDLKREFEKWQARDIERDFDHPQ
jgi:hypothetical protein